MTQEAFKAWWYNEGSQAPYTHHDCEEHTMRMCEIAWANGAYKEREALAQTQEPVAWMDADGNVSDNNDHKCFPIPLYTTPPQRTWVDLPDEEIKILWIQYRAALPRYLCFAKALLARSKEENT